MRFGLLINQDAPIGELVGRFRHAEALGFDLAYVADHTGDYRNLGGYWLDGWTTLAHVATQTERIRVGTLVTNPLLHHPAQLAKQAVAVDHLSGGRLELGIGSGIAGFDHAAMGLDYWGPRDRASRFTEFVEVIDGVLRSPSRSFTYEGRWFRANGTPVVPGPLQQPRPPITIGGQSPSAIRLAARLGDCWNTHGPFGASVQQIVDITAEQNERLDELCRVARRDPSSVRRSLLLFDVLDVWSSKDRLSELVPPFAAAGIEEFVLTWPPASREAWLDELEMEALATMR